MIAEGGGTRCCLEPRGGTRRTCLHHISVRVLCFFLSFEPWHLLLLPARRQKAAGRTVGREL